MANPYFNATYYLSNNPDVFAAGINTVEAAWAHYEQNGAREALNGADARKPAPWFDISYYLSQNEDLATAGLSPSQLFEHFTTYGISEGRAPSAATASVNAASLTAYAAANEDLRTAFGIAEGAEPTETQLIQLAQHFYQYGYQEGREGSPAEVDVKPGETFTLTIGPDNITGTAGNDVFEASNTTFQAADILKGGAGIDTFNYVDAGTTGGNLPAALVSEVEIINIRNVNGTAAVPATNEKATFAFGAVPDTQSVTITPAGGAAVTYTNTTGGAVTGDVVAAYFAANLPVGYSFTSLNGAQLVLTATAAGDAPNLVIGGSAAASQSVAIVPGTASVPSSGVDVTVNASNFVGATDFNSNLSSNKVAFTNLAEGQKVGFNGNGSLVTAGVDAGYAAAATSAVVNLTNGVKGGNVVVTGPGLKSLTVNSTGAANTIGALTGAATTTSTTIDAASNLTTGAVTNAGATLTIKGAGAVNLSTTALEATVTKVDASANAGGVTVALGSAVTQTVTGGAGNDVITSGAQLTTGSVDAGAGIDTLVLGTNVGHANTAALAAKYVNFETLRLNGTFDASLIAGITAIELSGANNTISKLSAAQAGAVTALADIGNTELALATATGTADVASLTLGNGKGAAFDAGALTINGFETLNIKANAKVGDADQTSVIASLVADKLTAINLTGSAVNLQNAATTKAVTIDATALTGDGAAAPVGLTIAGNVATGSTVTGSSVNDTFTLGTGFATYNGGAGKDTFNATAAQLNTGADYNVINGGDGEDTLNITGGLALNIVDNNLSKISGIEKIVVASTGANNQSIQTGGWFDAAFKTSGVDLTTTAAAGNITIDMTSFTGAATLATTSTGASIVSIQTGTSGGNDKVTVSAEAGTVAVTTAAGDDVVSVTTTTGNQTISTGAGNDTITVVGGIANTITGGAGADKITLGAGADTVVIGNTDSGITLETADVITNFKAAGADKLNLGFNGADGVNVNEAAAAVVDFATALTNANAALAALKVANPTQTELAAFQWDATNGYLFNDTNADGIADQVIVLTGVTGTTFAATDIVA